jgi:hypothetical protein
MTRALLARGRFARATALCLSSLCLPLVLEACGGGGGDDTFFAAPDDDRVAGDNVGETPTGQRFVDVLVEDACGRTRIASILTDEICGVDATAPAPEMIHASMLRDGVIDDDTIYAVDGTRLWVYERHQGLTGTMRSPIGGIGRAVSLANGPADSLVVASLDSGLVVVDKSDQMYPVISSQLALPGLALDVFMLDDGRAVIALGEAGVGIVDLTGEPTLTARYEVPGLASQVTVVDGHIYVAACSALHILDLATGEIKGTTWISLAYDGDILVAPAKDVAVQGGLAAVAAGRFGAVIVDVSDVTAPTVLGFCTRGEDLDFYASGVKWKNDRVFVAGGEWGVLEVDPLTCEMGAMPAFFNMPAIDEVTCADEPPWEILSQVSWVPWSFRFAFLWAAPPLGRDPIQVLVADDEVLAFGDARRVGVRSVDIFDIRDDAFAKVGRIEEPFALDGVRGDGGRLLFGGARGGNFVLGDDDVLTRVAFAPMTQLLPVGFIGDDPVYLDRENQVLVGDAILTPFTTPIARDTIAVTGTAIIASTDHSLTTFEVATSHLTQTSFPSPAILPPALALHDDGTPVFAAPEWNSARSGDGVTLAPHGAFGDDEIMDLGRWAGGTPTRRLVVHASRVFELASFAGRTRLVRHGADSVSVELVPRRYVGVFPHDENSDLVTLVAADRARYMSQVVTYDLSTTPPIELSSESFAGVAVGVVRAPSRLVVPVQNGQIRIYDTTTAVPSLRALTTVDDDIPPPPESDGGVADDDAGFIDGGEEADDAEDEDGGEIDGGHPAPDDGSAPSDDAGEPSNTTDAGVSP